MKGHIRERSPGHWAIVIDVRDPQTGKRKRRWHSFKGTKREAQVRCAQLIAEAQGGAAVNPSRIAVNQFLDRFERDWVALHVSAASAATLCNISLLCASSPRRPAPTGAPAR
jgi:Arm DNA-binding domain